MLRKGLIILAVAAAGLAAGCGDEETESEGGAAAPQAKTAAAKPPDPDKDPYTITCKDLADVQTANVYSRRASNTLAVEAKMRNMSQLQASTAIFYAMTELCKTKPASFKPAKAAVQGVKAGKYKADL